MKHNHIIAIDPDVDKSGVKITVNWKRLLNELKRLKRSDKKYEVSCYLLDKINS